MGVLDQVVLEPIESDGPLEILGSLAVEDAFHGLLERVAVDLDVW